MADFEATIDSSDLEALIKNFRDKGGDTAGIMANVAEILVSGVSDRYTSEGDGQWDPHAPATIAPPRFPHQLMQLSGNLAGSTEAHSGVDFAEATTGVAYIVFHLDGGPVIPKRNPFELLEDVFDEAEKFILDSLVDAL